MNGDMIMALIKCPECGRENVSDSADVCPDCGYGIKVHFDRIKLEEEERVKKRELEEKKAEREKEQLDAIPMPRKPNAKQTYFLAFMMFGIWGFLCLILPSPMNIIGLVFFIVIAIWQGSSCHNKEVEEYERAMVDFEKYKKEELRRIENEKLFKQYNESMKIKCPVCGSTNIEKISTTSRVVSVTTVGLASGKIGKQYKCKKCKHMW